jgi:hypothetical protein
MKMVEIGSLQVQGISNISINDTLNCSAIEIELKDDLAGTVLLNHEFVFDQIAGLPAGMSWSRVGNQIEMVLGTFRAETVWKVRIRLKNLSGSYTSWTEFVFN